MKWVKNISPSWPLRLGLGLVYVYSGYHILANPLAWAGFLPAWLSSGISSALPLDVYMRAQGGGELLIGLLLLIWFTPRWLVIVVASALLLEMLAILLFIGINTITFRDIGLLGAGLSLLFSLREQKASR